MSDFISVLDILADPARTGLTSIRDDLSAMDLRIRRYMDKGLTPDEMNAAQAARNILRAAEDILEKLP
jgi:hypothetical protein